MYGNYQIILLYIVLGIFGLIYGSATIFLNIKLQIKGYLT
ncbi:putative membrane protein [Acinetobacter baumannii 14216]|nr:putative membrane protein [Acinetobacter baumannii 397971]EXH54225.1 putative membrane protein [Acinetobacter baumannii 1533268]EXH90816.1 putative membrane protein [Acinetobacter baumannii 318814]EXI01012.1 putative membrane protein [Acinetobacter baumannii 607805]EXI03819.1 putative membrane protein [Acinetobacter baumannii 457946]EXR15202.1 putative membrane protein [Acinetobacter baumannii 1413735]EXR71158.1 putative membrane protein [Acinetobacter baumannii 14216]EXR88048.1 putative 